MGGIQITQVFWQALFLAAKPPATQVKKQATPTQSEDATLDSYHQGEGSSGNTVLEEKEEDRSEIGGEEDTPTQNDNSPVGPTQNRNLGLSDRNTQPPAYETQAATHLISSNSMLGSQLFYLGCRFTSYTAVPATYISTLASASSDLWLPRNVPASTCVPASKPVLCHASAKK